MSGNLEKKHSQNFSSTPNDEFLDWDDYEEDDEEEEDAKNESNAEAQTSDSKNIKEKKSSEIEEDTYNDIYNNSKTNKDYAYSNNTYRKNYIYNNRNSFANKKFSKPLKPFNKGYGNYDKNYYHQNTYYNKKKSNNDFYNNKEYYKTNKDQHNYETKKEYKTVEKFYDYENTEKYDRKNFGDNKFRGKKFGYNKYKNNDSNLRSTVSYSTRQFNDDNKNFGNKNYKYKNEYKKYEKEEEINEKDKEVSKEEENIAKPSFYNSKKNYNNIDEVPKPLSPPIKKGKFLKTEEFIKMENIEEIINKIVKDSYTRLKSMLNKNLEEEYGSLNINAATYVPKSKMLRNHLINNNIINYGGNYVNNDFQGQNFMNDYN